MKVRLRTSGGLANLQIEGELDTATLPPELASHLEQGLRDARLREAERAGSSLTAADVQRYELTLHPGAGEEAAARTYRIEDTCPDGELLDLVDSLLQEILRRRTGKP